MSNAPVTIRVSAGSPKSAATRGRIVPIGEPFGWISGSHRGSMPVSSIRSADQAPVATSYVAHVPASLQSMTGRPLSVNE